MSMKNSNDTIGNRTRDLPACSAVTQPTAPPRAPPPSSAEVNNVWSHTFTFGIRICDVARDNFTLIFYGPICQWSRSQWPRNIRSRSAAACLLGLWVRIPPRAWISVSYVCCQVSAPGWSLVQRSPTECGVSECDREASTMRRPWPIRACCAMGGKYMPMESRTFRFLAFWTFFVEWSSPILWPMTIQNKTNANICQVESELLTPLLDQQQQ
jgi:hypothetical protein